MPTRGNISRTQTTILLVVLLLAFLPTYLVLPFAIFIEILNAVAVALGIGVLVAYGRGFLIHTPGSGLSPGHLLVAGIFLSWIAVVTRLVWAWVTRLSGHPEWGQDHWFIAFAVWLFIMGGVLHLTASNAIEGKIPRSNWAWVGGLVAVGVLSGLVLIRFLTNNH